MTVEVTSEVPPELDRYRSACRVRSVDALGAERTYRVSLTNDVINGRTLLAGKRTDEHEYDHDTPDAPTSRVYDVAREWFAENGYEVRG
jgi:hypothetical protein